MELTRRYFLNLALNPGILGTRIAMYSMLALMIGALFWDLGERNDFEVCLYSTVDCIIVCWIVGWNIIELCQSIKRLTFLSTDTMMSCSRFNRVPQFPFTVSLFLFS
jgi:hypothetical protein